MRKIRPEDFDPNYPKKAAKGPTPEAVNMDGIVPIKAAKKAPISTSPIKTEPPTPSARTDEGNHRTAVRTDERTEPQPRSTKRHPFEIYADQLTRLKKLKAMQTLAGQDTSMSAMVRDALDTYLNKAESKQ